MNKIYLNLTEPHCVGSCKWTYTASGERCLVCGVVGIDELKNKKCTKCGTKLFNSFSNTWHNQNICGDSKKALAPSPDCG